MPKVATGHAASQLQAPRNRLRTSLWAALTHPKVMTHLVAYTFLLPALVFMGVFTFYPIIRGLPLAFTNYSVVGETEWVGLRNFQYALQDETFRLAFKHSLQYLLVVPVIQFLSILIAVLVNRQLPGIGLFRTAYYVPVVTSMVAVAITWQWMYQSNGLINWVLMKLGILSEPISWLGDERFALPAVMAVTAWKGLGYYMVIYLAGLQSIPRELSEQAMIDGASSWQVVRHVIIPLLQPFILLASIVSCQGALNVFDEVITMTDGGPHNATITNAVYAYKVAFQQFEFGRGAAISLLAGSVSWVLTILMFKVFRDRGVYSL
ncbi:MAG: sugar ABC transporter permease [Firmicutes bacterium]|nr:sugar ABC transporter permease [Bacillota bacterium]